MMEASTLLRQASRTTPRPGRGGSITDHISSPEEKLSATMPLGQVLGSISKVASPTHHAAAGKVYERLHGVVVQAAR